MAFGQQITIRGPNISPNLGLTQSLSDDVDRAAMAFGDDLLLRIDPRDIVRDNVNTTGAKRVHRMAPHGDGAVFRGSGFSVGTVSGKYDGREVFKLDRTGTAAANTNNDFRVGPRSLSGVTAFTVFGAAHFDSGMLGTGNFRPLIALYRDKSTLEACIAYQRVSSVDYLSIYADQGDGNGVNHNLNTSVRVSADTPFAYAWRVRSTGSVRSSLFFNQVEVSDLDQSGSMGMEAGSIEVYIGHLTADGDQWSGGHGRAYVIAGDAFDTADRQTASEDLMLQIKTLYGIA